MLDRPLRRHLAFFGHHLAQQLAVHPLHHHVHPRPVVLGVDAHHVGVVQRQPDRLLALEAVKQRRVRLHREMRNLQRNLASIAQVGGAKDGSHPALGDGSVNAEMVQFLAGFKVCGKAHRLAFLGPDVLAFRAELHGRSTDRSQYRWPPCSHLAGNSGGASGCTLAPLALSHTFRRKNCIENPQISRKHDRRRPSAARFACVSPPGGSPIGI